MSDPYNPQEAFAQLTRGSLELIDKYRFGVSLTTKSSLIERDIDLLVRIHQHSPVLVLMTVTTADDALAALIEPFSSKPSQRFESLRKLSAANIPTGILMMPILPWINDTPENIRAIISQAKSCGVRYLYPAFGVTLRQNQRDYYYEQLDRHFPGMKEKYIRAYGDKYVCESPRAYGLSALFNQECRRLGIMTGMSDIIRDYQSGFGEQQLKLF